jgi:hypothetical protein
VPDERILFYGCCKKQVKIRAILIRIKIHLTYPRTKKTKKPPLV